MVLAQYVVVSLWVIVLLLTKNTFYSLTSPLMCCYSKTFAANHYILILCFCFLDLQKKNYNYSTYFSPCCIIFYTFCRWSYCWMQAFPLLINICIFDEGLLGHFSNNLLTFKENPDNIKTCSSIGKEVLWLSVLKFQFFSKLFPKKWA